jgi:hypothetical protein
MAEAKGGSLAAKIKKARVTAAKLAEKSNELNDVLLKAQDAIAALRLGVSASVLMHIEETNAAETYLSFERYEGKWSLTILEGHPAFEEWSTTPLLKASRRLRMEASKLLPALVDKLMEQTEKEIGEVDESKSAVVSFVKELQEAQS